jgi:glycosyltransferase involved in cell wall biosynthesis
MAKPTISVITTVLNEAKGIDAFLRSLLDQSRTPDEIIICDAGSDDGTVEIIRRYLEEGYPARLIIEKRANRSRGRNLAIEEAKGEIIASIDAGCVANMDWLSKLVAPFESDDPPDITSGYYQPEAESAFEEAIAVATVPDAIEVDPDSFLPSSRSVAFRRDAWERVGGYPEYANYAEDTEFDLRLKAAGYRFRFVLDAVVRWRVRTTLWDVFRQFFRYARSDGEVGHWFGHYAKAFIGLAVFILLGALTANGARWAPPAFVFLLLVYWARYTIRARRRDAEWWPSLISPGISLTVDLAHITGYTLGLLRRRPRPPLLPTNRPLSIAQITYTYATLRSSDASSLRSTSQPITGGADVYVRQLGEVIVNAGHQHWVYQRAAETDDPSVRRVPNLLRGLPLEFWTQALALFRLRREILSHDIVICHYPHYLLAVDLMSFFGRRPMRVGLSHGVFWDDAPWWTPRSLIKLIIARLAFRRAHAYISNDTHFLRAMGLRIEPRQGMHSRIAPRVWFIPNGVDTHEFQRVAPLPEIAERNAILVPRNLFRNRGIHLAIEAFAQFRARHPETTLFIVGGGGQPAYVEQLKRMVADLVLADSVVFYGPAPHDQLPAIYSSAQLTLIPSLCGEGTSLAALESMACGIATICTFVAGLRDLPGPHALPMVSSLAETMESVWPERAKIGEDQRARLLAHYSIERWRRSWGDALGDVGVKDRAVLPEVRRSLGEGG